RRRHIQHYSCTAADTCAEPLVQVAEGPKKHTPASAYAPTTARGKQRTFPLGTGENVPRLHFMASTSCFCVADQGTRPDTGRADRSGRRPRHLKFPNLDIHRPMFDG